MDEEDEEFHSADEDEEDFFDLPQDLGLTSTGRPTIKTSDSQILDNGTSSRDLGADDRSQPSFSDDEESDPELRQELVRSLSEVQQKRVKPPGFAPGFGDGDSRGSIGLSKQWNLRVDGDIEQLEPVMEKLKITRDNVKLSKMLSYLLRHAAHKLDVDIRKDGYVRVKTVMNLKQFRVYSLEELMAVVFFDEKERYTMVREFDSELLVRANQGHTLKIVDDVMLLTKIEDPNEFPEVVHGSYLVHWPFIKSQGLSKVARNHIHLANGVPEDGKIRGMRSSAELFVYIDIRKAMEDGIVFFRSKNDVILTQGDEGWLASKYFVKVLRIDYEALDEEELEYVNCDRPCWPAELAPTGPGDGGTYAVKNLEALIIKCKTRFNELAIKQRSLEESGNDPECAEILELKDQMDLMHAELLSLEKRLRQHKGIGRTNKMEREDRAQQNVENTTVIERMDRAATPPWAKRQELIEPKHGITNREKEDWAALGRRRDDVQNMPPKEDKWSSLRKEAPTKAANRIPGPPPPTSSLPNAQDDDDDDWNLVRRESRKEKRERRDAAASSVPLAGANNPGSTPAAPSFQGNSQMSQPLTSNVGAAFGGGPSGAHVGDAAPGATDAADALINGSGGDRPPKLQLKGASAPGANWRQRLLDKENENSKKKIVDDDVVPDDSVSNVSNLSLAAFEGGDPALTPSASENVRDWQTGAGDRPGAVGTGEQQPISADSGIKKQQPGSAGDPGAAARPHWSAPVAAANNQGSSGLEWRNQLQSDAAGTTNNNPLARGDDQRSQQQTLQQQQLLQQQQQQLQQQQQQQYQQQQLQYHQQQAQHQQNQQQNMQQQQYTQQPQLQQYATQNTQQNMQQQPQQQQLMGGPMQQMQIPPQMQRDVWQSGGSMAPQEPGVMAAHMNQTWIAPDGTMQTANTQQQYMMQPDPQQQQHMPQTNNMQMGGQQQYMAAQQMQGQQQYMGQQGQMAGQQSYMQPQQGQQMQGQQSFMQPQQMQGQQSYMQPQQGQQMQGQQTYMQPQGGQQMQGQQYMPMQQGQYMPMQGQQQYMPQGQMPGAPQQPQSSPQPQLTSQTDGSWRSSKGQDEGRQQKGKGYGRGGGTLNAATPAFVPGGDSSGKGGKPDYGGDSRGLGRGNRNQQQDGGAGDMNSQHFQQHGGDGMQMQQFPPQDARFIPQGQMPGQIPQGQLQQFSQGQDLNQQQQGFDNQKGGRTNFGKGKEDQGNFQQQGQKMFQNQQNQGGSIRQDGGRDGKGFGGPQNQGLNQDKGGDGGRSFGSQHQGGPKGQGAASRPFDERGMQMGFKGENQRYDNKGGQQQQGQGGQFFDNTRQQQQKGGKGLKAQNQNQSLGGQGQGPFSEKQGSKSFDKGDKMGGGKGGGQQDFNYGGSIGNGGFQQQQKGGDKMGGQKGNAKGKKGGKQQQGQSNAPQGPRKSTDDDAWAEIGRARQVIPAPK